MTQPVTPVAGPVVDPETPEAHVSPEAEPTEPSFRPIDSQEALDALIQKRVARAEKSAEKKFNETLATLQAKIDGFESEKLTDTEKRDKRIAELEKAVQERDEKLTKLERAKTVSELAHEAKLPKKLWDRVQGDTEDEIAADIQELLEAYPTPESKDEGKKKPPSQGATVKVQPTGSDGETEETADAILEAIAPRYRG